MFAMTLSSIAPLAFVPTVASADTGVPSATVTATYDPNAQTLTVSGSFSGAPSSSSKKPGFATFINSNNPTTSSLDGTLNLLAQATSGTFSKVYSSVASMPTTVCVAIYDTDFPSPPATGSHSLVPAGATRNDDNSWDKSSSGKPANSFSSSSCVTPAQVTKVTITTINNTNAPFAFTCPANPLLNPVTVSGNGSGTAPPGDASQYKIQIDWGDGNQTNGLGTFTPASGHVNFSFTFTSPAHTYATAGNYTIKARLYHSNPPGQDNQADTVATVPVCIIVTNTPPVLSNVPTSVTIPELAPYTFTATATDSDVPAQTLTFSLVGAPAGASINSSTGVFTWTPTEAQGPGVYPFTVRVSDGSNNTDAPITITVTEVNSLPVATGASVSTHMNIPLLINLAGSDSDIPANFLTYLIVDSPLSLSGTLGSVSGNQVTFTPATDYVGPASFTFKINDGTGDSNTATVNITVGNDAPTLSTIANQTVDEQTLLTVTPSATDPNSDTLTYSVTNAPAGSSFDTSTGVLTWTPTEAQGPGVYSGIIITVSDGSGSDSQTFSITVNEVNVAPVANNLSITTDEDTATSSAVTATDVDLPANTLMFGIVTGPLHGTVTAFNTTSGAFTYNPSANYNGSDSFTFEANDGTASSTTATVSITVNPVEDVSYQCSDDSDNDHDGFTDSQDPQCHTDGNAQNEDSYNPQDNDESGAITQCNDGLDNDNHEDIDAQDPQCHTDGNPENNSSYDPSINNESVPVNTTDVCANIDGIQNTAPSGMMVSGANCIELPGDNVPPPGGGGGGNGPVNFGGVNGGGGSVLGASIGPAGQVLGESCGLYMGQHLRIGSSKNNPDQVKKLQAFLNKWMNAGLPTTGFFGPLTLAQVNAFQAKYGDDILKPWGLNAPTGLVYLATLTKINKLECPELTLTLPTLVPWSQNPNAQ